MHIAFSSLVLISIALGAVNPDNYPKPFTVAPVNYEWSRIYLDGKSIPNIPLTKSGYDTSNWEKDVFECKSKDDWAITLDDGPSAYTRNITAEFGLVNAKGTFFVVGSQILTFNAELKALADAGHQIGVHTWSHKPLSTLTNDQIVSEIIWTAKLIREVTGLTPKYVRSPQGDIDERVRAVIKAIGMTHVTWNHDTFDWKLSEKSRTATEVISDVSAWTKAPRNATGVISLHHDINKDSAAAFVPSIHLIAAAKYNLKTVAECIGDKQPYNNAILDRLPATQPTSTTTDQSTQPAKLAKGIPTVEVSESSYHGPLTFSVGFVFMLVLMRI